jgi:hypothetical protein
MTATSCAAAVSFGGGGSCSPEDSGDRGVSSVPTSAIERECIQEEVMSSDSVRHPVHFCCSMIAPRRSRPIPHRETSANQTRPAAQSLHPPVSPLYP